MGFSVTQSHDPGADAHVVTVRVHLSLSETNSLFLSGDILVSWPPGEFWQGDEPELAASDSVRGVGSMRTGMFVSELARLAHGLKIGYRQATAAERAGQLVRLQLLRAGIAEET